MNHSDAFYVSQKGSPGSTLQTKPRQCVCLCVDVIDETSVLPVMQSATHSSNAVLFCSRISGAGILTSLMLVMTSAELETPTDAAAVAASKKPDPGMIAWPLTCGEKHDYLDSKSVTTMVRADLEFLHGYTS